MASYRARHLTKVLGADSPLEAPSLELTNAHFLGQKPLLQEVLSSRNYLSKASREYLSASPRGTIPPRDFISPRPTGTSFFPPQEDQWESLFKESLSGGTSGGPPRQGVYFPENHHKHFDATPKAKFPKKTQNTCLFSRTCYLEIARRSKMLEAKGLLFIHKCISWHANTGYIFWLQEKAEG